MAAGSCIWSAVGWEGGRVGGWWWWGAEVVLVLEEEGGVYLMVCAWLIAANDCLRHHLIYLTTAI